MNELSDFLTLFGLFKFLILNAGYFFFWWSKMELARSERHMKGFEFSFGYFVQKHWVTFVSTSILVWVASPLFIIEYEIESNMGIFTLGATGGLAVQRIIQIPINYLSKK